MALHPQLIIIIIIIVSIPKNYKNKNTVQPIPGDPSIHAGLRETNICL